jgi:hypothetical protein
VGSASSRIEIFPDFYSGTSNTNNPTADQPSASLGQRYPLVCGITIERKATK